MNFVRRGLISVLRKRGKSAILLILVFILGNVMAGVISVKAAVGNTQKIMREKIGVLASIEVDYDAYNETGGIEPIGPIPTETIHAIGRLDGVKQYDYLSKLSLESNEIEAYYDDNPGPIKPLYRSDDLPMPEPDKGGTILPAPDDPNPYENWSYFQLVGGQNPDILDQVYGQITLYQGRTFSEDEIANSVNAVVISRKLAEKNGLSVGSTIQMKKQIYKYEYDILPRKDVDIMPIPGMPGKPGTPEIVIKTFELTVIGIFEPVERPEADPSEPYYGYIDFNNQMYTTNKAIDLFNQVIMETERELNGTETTGSYSYVLPVFTLKDPLGIEAFQQEAAPLLPKFYKLTDTSEDFQYIATPMKNMDWIATLILGVTIGATLLILSLLITLFLRDRRHEMGIYRSLGESRVRVAGQILTEVLLIGILAVSLSLVSGNLIAGNMSDKMLANQIAAEQALRDKDNDKPWYETPSELEMLGYNSEVSEEELIESYQVRIGAKTVLLFYLVGIGSLVISTAVPILYVIRLNPKKILM